MPTFRGNAFSNFFNRLLQIDQSGNNNVDSTTRSVQSGGGTNTSISLSDDQLLVKPQNDDTTSALDVKTSGGTSILTADTTNKRVLCGSSQVNALTQYKEFNVYDFDPAIGYHMVLFPGSAIFGTSANLNEFHLGEDADPAKDAGTNLDVSAESIDTYGLSPAYWYLPDAITIMEATILMGGGASPDSALNFHLMSYDIDTSTNYGDLSNGVVVADSGSTTAVDEDVIKVATMTNLPTDVAANKVILATVESDATTSISVKMIVKYHIQ